tara:strand:- start:22715 stop:23866 length:1152 start_codon:yes stop_codon:yes gene_type:complete
MKKKKIKILIFTGTRAEYGIMSSLIDDIDKDKHLELSLLVSGSHLSPEFGETYKEIENDGKKIDEKVEIILSSDTPIGVSKSVGLGLISYSESLARIKPNLVIILGDRFEALAMAQVCTFSDIPIMHLHGGEKSEGAFDDSLRHAITKLSHFHCTSCDVYKNRVLQLGEPSRFVRNFGALSIDNFRRSQLLSKAATLKKLKLNNDDPFMLITYHPATLGEDPVLAIDNLLDVLKDYSDYNFIFTYPNADQGGRKIISKINNFISKNNTNSFAFESLGHQLFLSSLKHSECIIGNSSSGIIEAPSLKVPTLDIGERQKGRVCADSVVHCKPNKKSIKINLDKIISNKHNMSYLNPYQKANTSLNILKFIKSIDLNYRKKFVDFK